MNKIHATHIWVSMLGGREGLGGLGGRGERWGEEALEVKDGGSWKRGLKSMMGGLGKGS
jgi:hypothetical protein